MSPTCYDCDRLPVLRLWLDRESFEKLHGQQLDPETEKLLSSSFFTCKEHKMSLVRALGRMAESTEVIRLEELD
jgi:hypothetical protein